MRLHVFPYGIVIEYAQARVAVPVHVSAEVIGEERSVAIYLIAHVCVDYALMAMRRHLLSNGCL